MNLEQLVPTPGSRTKPYRKGRGIGSGIGKTSGKGEKGQKASRIESLEYNGRLVWR